LFDHLTAQWLNVLVGNLAAPGGVLVPEQIPLSIWPELAPDRIAQAGRERPRLDGAGTEEPPLLRSDPERLMEAILASSPYATEVLLILDADPALTSTAPERFTAAVDRIPLVVSFAALPDDSALLADWILPQAHFLERWDLFGPSAGVAFPVVSLAKPAVEKPIHDVRPAAEILFEIARRTGGNIAEEFPWKGSEELIRREVEVLYEAHRGAVLGTEFDEAWVRLMERAGWWAPGYRTADGLWSRMQETGGWWDPFYDHKDWNRVLQTPSGRYEIRADLVDSSPREAEARAPADDSLALLLFEPLAIAGGTGAELPFLQEILDPGHEEGWRTWAELNPETAHRLGIDDKQLVRIDSPYGSIAAHARVTTRITAGAVAVPVGLGKRSGGRWARGVGANPLQLLAPVRDPLCGLPDMGSTRVRLSVLQGAGEERDHGRGAS
jgi:anaerobic selenocysteine-containing dehydrogenase